MRMLRRKSPRLKRALNAAPRMLPLIARSWSVCTVRGTAAPRQVQLAVKRAGSYVLEHRDVTDAAFVQVRAVGVFVLVHVGYTSTPTMRKRLAASRTASPM